MRITELLLEYRRDVTAQQVGARVLMAVAKDTGLLPPEVESIHLKLAQMRNVSDVNQLAAVIKPEFQPAWIESVLAAIEDRDPTANKAYTPWLARMYAKGTLRMEDINRNNLLSIYDMGKKRRRISPEHSDINRFKSYRDFEDVMWMTYDHDDLEGNEPTDQGKASKFYEDGDVTVIVPEDEAAACRYGRGTRWCTAATRGDNLFSHYNRSGPLYILIPKKPKYQGEKYQLHFQKMAFMDERDDPVDLLYILTVRFPQLKDVFVKTWPTIIGELLWLLPEKIIKDAIRKIYEYMSSDKQKSHYLSEMAHNDEGFLSWGRNSSKFDDNLSWVDNYLKYKPGALDNLTRQLKKLLISPDKLLEEAGNMELSYPRMRDIPEMIYEHIYQEGIYDNYEIGGEVIIQSLRDVSVKLVGDKVYVERRDWSDDD